VISSLKNRGVQGILLAAAALEEFAGTWDARYPMIAKSWRARRWCGYESGTGKGRFTQAAVFQKKQTKKNHIAATL
jgi:hypothetical protein